MESLLEDTFKLNDIIKSNFENVRRIKGKTEIYDLNIDLDINSNIYDMVLNENYFFSLQKIPVSIANQTFEDEELENPLFEQYEYVMRGKVFESKSIDKELHHIGISFGGLLFGINGLKAHLKNINNDDTVYILLKKA